MSPGSKFSQILKQFSFEFTSLGSQWKNRQCDTNAANGMDQHFPLSEIRLGFIHQSMLSAICDRVNSPFDPTHTQHYFHYFLPLMPNFPPRVEVNSEFRRGGKIKKLDAKTSKFSDPQKLLLGHRGRGGGSQSRSLLTSIFSRRKRKSIIIWFRPNLSRITNLKCIEE